MRTIVFLEKDQNVIQGTINITITTKELLEIQITVV